MDKQLKRLFFAFDVEALWPDTFPEGRVIEKIFRHLTMAFCGEMVFSEKFFKIVLPPFLIGKAAFFDQVVFLPKKHPHVVAWHMHWLYGKEKIENYYSALKEFLEKNDLMLPQKKKEKFLSHVTIARQPFQKDEWKTSFFPLPCYIKALHLFESLGFSQYKSLWKHDLLAPFDPIPHTADFAFRIRGESFSELFANAKLALAFQFPKIFTSYISKEKEVKNLEEVIFALNEIVTLCDEEVGCPIKAVSFSGEVLQNHLGIFTWDMVIDV